MLINSITHKCVIFSYFRLKFRNELITFILDRNVGGVLAMTLKDFQRVNGYHILLYGWGDEDRDMMQR